MFYVRRVYLGFLEPSFWLVCYAVEDVEPEENSGDPFLVMIGSLSRRYRLEFWRYHPSKQIKMVCDGSSCTVFWVLLLIKLSFD